MLCAVARKKKQKHDGGKKALGRLIFNVFINSPNTPLNYKQVSAAINATDKSQRTAVAQLLDEFSQKNKLSEVSPGKYMLPEHKRATVVEGIIEFTRKGAGFVSNDEGDDIYIPPKNTGVALTGDLVSVKTKRKRGRGRIEGEVLEVVKRGKQQYVGVVEFNEDFAFVVCQNPKIHVDFFVAKPDLNRAAHGQKVVVELLEWRDPTKNPRATITNVLGEPGENNAEIHAILAEFELPDEFPKKVEDAAAKVSERITSDEISVRRDMRDVVTFTIDPVDAKDFDDALSVKDLGNGEVELGVHIADVSHYVVSGGAIDKEAQARAFSVYLVDRVIPMLPERLSNLLCSLRPNEDKLAFSAVFHLDKVGKVKKEWFGKTVICSKRRFTYEEAQEIIDGADGDFDDEINRLNGLAKTIRKERMASGALAIEGSELRFELDDAGKPLGVVKKISKDSNKLIEEFMLLANKQVAKYLEKGGEAMGKKPAAVYRVHDIPDVDKLKDLSRLLFGFNIRVGFSNVSTAGAIINKTLSSIDDDAVRGLIQKEVIKSMAKAVYSVENIGHYGLAFSHYTHFTSPIRRYPDLLVHRILQEVLAKDGKYSYDKPEVDRLCKHSSLIERKAIDAERASIRYKQAEYMSGFIGEKFLGVVVSVVDWGFYVELENGCEGLVSMKSLEDDYYYFDSETRQIRGHNTAFTLGIGDNVEVRVAECDMQLMRVDLTLVNLFKQG